VLGLADLLRFCDAEGLEVSLSNILLGPPYLAVAALPEPCLARARKRLEAYLRDEAPERSRAPVRGVLSHLATLPALDQEALLAEFMTFTNDLDASRRQRLGDAAPELVALIAEAGFRWKDDRRFVPLAPARA